MSSARTHYQTISLIGMPGVGKSTVGVILAKLIGLDFTDTDLSIQAREQCRLQDILEQQGHVRLREIEEEVLLEIPIENRILATGGSVIYSQAIMDRLLEAGPVVYLHADVYTLQSVTMTVSSACPSQKGWTTRRLVTPLQSPRLSK